MGTISRFEALSASLAAAYRQASDDQRRRAALAMCLLAVEQAELQSGEVDGALALLRRDIAGSRDVQQKLDRLAEQLDEEYFRLSEDTENITPESLVMYRKARAAAARGDAGG